VEKLWKYGLKGANVVTTKIGVRLTHAYAIDRMVGGRNDAGNQTNNVVMFRGFSEGGDSFEFGSNKTFITTGKKTVRLFDGKFDEQGVPTDLAEGDAAFACELNGLVKVEGSTTWPCFDEEVYENAPASARGTSYYDNVQKHPCVWILDDTSVPFVFDTFGAKLGKLASARFDMLADTAIRTDANSEARRKDELKEVAHTTKNLSTLQTGRQNNRAIAKLSTEEMKEVREEAKALRLDDPSLSMKDAIEGAKALLGYE